MAKDTQLLYEKAIENRTTTFYSVDCVAYPRVSRSRLAGKAIYFVTRAKILEDSNCCRFCANPDIAIITAHTKFALAEEERSGRERDSVERRRRSPHKGGREGV
jgi:hypothetical protein